jgi:hypothetical protein
MQKHLNAGNVCITLDIFQAKLVRVWANAHVYNSKMQITRCIRSSVFFSKCPCAAALCPK